MAFKFDDTGSIMAACDAHRDILRWLEARRVQAQVPFSLISTFNLSSLISNDLVKFIHRFVANQQKKYTVFELSEIVLIR